MVEQSGGATESQPKKRPDPLVGRVVNDRFRIIALIARGGMGKVYRAEQAPLGREIALKVLTPTYSGDTDPEFHKRFFLEASTCSKLTHPNTVTIFDYGRTDDDIYYIAMELLEGLTLHRLLRNETTISPARAMHVARQICRSLREAHTLGVIHRDLKPANVFLMKHGDENDFVKVLDFGLVKDLEDAEDLTQTGLFMGSPKYMSPEQIRGEKVDPRADVYALGVITYEMLTGRVPFDKPNSVNILMAHVHEAPPAMIIANPEAEVPASLEAVVMRALAKDPNDRFESMDALLVTLKGLSPETGLSISRSSQLAISGGELGTTGRYGAAGPSSRPPAEFAISSQPEIPVGLDALEIDPGGTRQTGAAEPAPGRATVPIVMALLGTLALATAGVVAYFANPDRAGDPIADTTERLPVETDPHPAAEPEPEPVIESTMVVLRSEPSGAAVLVDENEYGPTPADVEWTGVEAERGRRVTFLFRMDGHRDYSVTRVITGDRLEVDAELVAIRRAIRTTRPNRPRRPRGGVAPVKGYKTDPY